MATGALDDIAGFNQKQRQEEQLKAQLILRNDAWRRLIERAETHPYFRGDIDFLLRFSDIFERAAKSPPADWTDIEESAFRQSFAEWYGRACAIFPTDTNVWPVRLPDFLWERALLATGDYLLPSKSNLSFLDDTDRDASWKRLLRADTRVPDRDARRDVVRRVLARIDPKDVATSLRAVIAAGVQGNDTQPVLGFRSRLVADPIFIKYCEQRRLRHEDGSVFLLTRITRNGRHVDLDIYELYLRLGNRAAALAPFTQPLLQEQFGTYPPSRIVLRAAGVGATLTVEKQGKAVQLWLQLPKADVDLMARLANWGAEGESSFRQTVLAYHAEVAIFEAVAALRP